ncbi:YdeI/OmpD-associated family protein [Hydrogenophaga sp. 5NK40-0174]|uniref:YdeI/OmpD-associated family protein n=1 Tax=Hydrogenophaga sp. 5NK40-0174 TaxID=3127649 RepID=UPI00310A59A1
MAMIKRVDEFFARGCGRCERFDTSDCSARQWESGLAVLRQLCLDAGLEETAKWGHPTYVHAGRNIAILGAFRADFRLNFMDAALLKDPKAVLRKQGENSQHASMLSFASADEARAMAATIRAYLAEAMGYAEAGLKPPKSEPEMQWPVELTDALDADPDMAQAFHRLTPGRQRSYVINLSTAKKPETRLARMGKFRDRILAGKGANEL